MEGKVWDEGLFNMAIRPFVLAGVYDRLISLNCRLVIHKSLSKSIHFIFLII